MQNSELSEFNREMQKINTKRPVLNNVLTLNRIYLTKFPKYHKHHKNRGDVHQIDLFMRLPKLFSIMFRHINIRQLKESPPEPQHISKTLEISDIVCKIYGIAEKSWKNIKIKPFNNKLIFNSGIFKYDKYFCQIILHNIFVKVIQLLLHDFA